MDREKVIEKIVEELFESFLKEPYLANILPSYQNLIALIKRITKLLNENVIPAIRKRDKNTLKDFCLNLGKIHWKLQISEVQIFKSINFFKERLVRNKAELGLTDEDIEFWIEHCNKYIAVSYIEGLIWDTINTIDGDNEFTSFFKRTLEDLLDLINELKKADKPIKTTSFCKIEDLAFFDTDECLIGKLINSVSFAVKAYADLPLKLRFEADHKDLHKYLQMFLEYLFEERYEGAVYILREFIIKLFSLEAILKELELLWELNKDDNFVKFLADEYYSFGNLIIVLPKTDSEKEKEKLLTLFEKGFTSQYGERFLLGNTGYYTDFFLLRDKTSIFIYIDKRRRSYEKLYRYVTELANTLSNLQALSFEKEESPAFILGKVDTGRFHKLTPEFIKELLSVMKETLKKEAQKVHGHFFEVDFNLIFSELISETLKVQEFKYIVREAVKNGNVKLFYQPIVDLFSKEFFGIEILSRITYGDKVFSAGEFIELVKRENLTVEFDTAVLKKVLKSLKKIKKISKNVFINVFPDTLMDTEVVNLLLQLIDEMDREGLKLFLELTEHSILTNRKILEKIKRGNVNIAFDDFGSGYTNFKMVGCLAYHGKAKILKIDGELVKAIFERPTYEKVIETITLFAKNLNLGVVYEYVADEKIYEKIKEIARRCSIKNAYGQGYYFAEPQPVG